MKVLVRKRPVKDKKEIYKKYVVKKVVVYPDKTEYWVEPKKKKKQKKKKEVVENEADKGRVSKTK